MRSIAFFCHEAIADPKAIVIVDTTPVPISEHETGNVELLPSGNSTAYDTQWRWHNRPSNLPVSCKAITVDSRKANEDYFSQIDDSVSQFRPRDVYSRLVFPAGLKRKRRKRRE